MPADDETTPEQPFEQSPDAAYLVDPLEDSILDVNHATCAMLGYSREELPGLPVSYIHPAEIEQMRDFVANVLRDGSASTIKLTCRTKRGTFLSTEMALFALDSDGRVYILGLVQDRSDHRQPNP
jgi:PAS domain S-box-containing protein